MILVQPARNKQFPETSLLEMANEYPDFPCSQTKLEAVGDMSRLLLDGSINDNRERTSSITSSTSVATDKQQQGRKRARVDYDPSTTTVTKPAGEEKKSGSKWYANATALGTDFQPGEYDVICARGRQAFHHKGNAYFRALVEKHFVDYGNAKSKSKRSSIVSLIIRTIRRKGKGGFVKQFSDGVWMEVGDALAREKVCQMMRNHIGAEFKSSIQGKKALKAKRRSIQKDEKLHELLQSHPEVKRASQNLEMVARNPEWPEAACSVLFNGIMVDMMNGIKSDGGALRQRFLLEEARLQQAFC